jgi:hypothetical protein
MTVLYNPTQENLVQILMDKTQNNDPLFFRILVAYNFAKIASMMRTSIEIPGKDKIPVNMYAMNLAVSGSGKGHSKDILEDKVIAGFRKYFLNITFPSIARDNIKSIADRRAMHQNTKPEDEEIRATKEFEDMGPLLFSFDSGTTAAVKQMRHKLVMANAGSMNFEMDEIGSNFLGNVDVLGSFLELYDMGKIKQKLVKSTRDNTRMEDLTGTTPANMMLFGTPSKLLNGSKVEEEFYEMLETGYARRCFFGYCRDSGGNSHLSSQELYDIFTDTSSDQYVQQLGEQVKLLADKSNFNQILRFEKPVALELLDYMKQCEVRSKKFSEYEEVKKTEMRHRYFKAAKLAGAYAFMDNSINVTSDHLQQAISLAEDSGYAFQKILTRDRNHVKLANYITSIGREVTQADMVEDLPFFKGSVQDRTTMLNLAIAHGYKNNMVIRKEIIDNIEFLKGESLAETDINNITIAYSKHFTEGYKNENVKFDEIHRLCETDGYHWVNHHLMAEQHGGYRDEAHAIAGFNLAVIDCDGGVSIDTVKMLLKDYTYFIHTTKRHTPQAHRFRLILPLSHIVQLDSHGYREFMNNLYDWLPFDVDKQTNQRSRKWETKKGWHTYNHAELLDALQFIPKTKKAEEQRATIERQGSLTNLERWFINTTRNGNRNNQLAKYAFALVDMNYDLDTIKNNVLALNSKLENPLAETEVLSTVLVSAGNKIRSKGDDNDES